MQNHDAQLSECLRKLSFCDEIVVVADRCTDRSQDVARRQGAVVIDGIFPLESQRKAAGVEACSGDWILEIDPDELVDPALAWEIRAVLQMRPVGDWYDLPIDNYLGETLVRDGWAGALSARAEPRLYKRGFKAWEARRLNAPAVMAGRHGGALKGAIRRSLGRDVGALIERLNRLTALSAEDLADATHPAKLTSGLLAGVGIFLRGYVAQGGWREGRLGLLIALLSGLLPIIARTRAADIVVARQTAGMAEADVHAAAKVARWPEVAARSR